MARRIRRAKRVKRRPKARVFKRTPKTHELIDPARDLTQARQLQKAWPKEYRPVIVKTGKARGKGKVVFPYHIAGLRGKV